MNRNFPLSCALLCLFAFSFTRASDPRSDYSAVANRIIEAALTNQGAWQKLAYLCDRIGPRMSGSTQLAQSLTWAADEMRRDGLSGVELQPVEVTHWVRGAERAWVQSPVFHRLHMLGLGRSIGTPAGGLSAPILVVSSFDELEAMDRSRVEGRIVVYNVPYQGYGRTAAYRTSGASRAAALGAVAVLVRSVTPVSLRTPHTGTLSYASDQPRIPAAAVSIEDALLLQRLYASGDTVTVHLEMEARNLPAVVSANVVGEIRGTELPDEVVLIGAHIDSWDVGQGAHDDGVGVAVCMETARLLLDLGLRPRRTLRVVLFTDEENGGLGGVAYRQRLGEAVSNHVAAIEMDAGGETPLGFGLGTTLPAGPAYERALAQVQAIGGLLQRIGADTVRRGGGGADIGPLMRSGVPGLGLITVGRHYFDWHHSEADTLDKVDPDDLRKNLAAMAVMAFVLADLPERLYTAVDEAPR